MKLNTLKWKIKEYSKSNYGMNEIDIIIGASDLLNVGRGKVFVIMKGFDNVSDYMKSLYNDIRFESGEEAEDYFYKSIGFEDGRKGYNKWSLDNKAKSKGMTSAEYRKWSFDNTAKSKGMTSAEYNKWSFDNTAKSKGMTSAEYNKWLFDNRAKSKGMTSAEYNKWLFDNRAKSKGMTSAEYRKLLLDNAAKSKGYRNSNERHMIQRNLHKIIEPLILIDKYTPEELSNEIKNVLGYDEKSDYIKNIILKKSNKTFY